MFTKFLSSGDSVLNGTLGGFTQRFSLGRHLNKTTEQKQLAQMIQTINPHLNNQAMNIRLEKQVMTTQLKHQAMNTQLEYLLPSSPVMWQILIERVNAYTFVLMVI
ncbi:hypothetical protein DPMN_095573 [Dreissena polymorpha]|uniref:Uncharacterized protein n=1 Tax=Dreissena polymorpha TaxID=45954 RepID=A0A9D4R4L7_DREPO|nr:hypothetical protein DPMN_095573 [Dreissena polymorpha]